MICKQLLESLVANYRHKRQLSNDWQPRWRTVVDFLFSECSPSITGSDFTLFFHVLSLSMYCGCVPAIKAKRNYGQLWNHPFCYFIIWKILHRLHPIWFSCIFAHQCDSNWNFYRFLVTIIGQAVFGSRFYNYSWDSNCIWVGRSFFSSGHNLHVTCSQWVSCSVW